MTPAEMAARVSVKRRQRADRSGPPDFSRLSTETTTFPKLPNPLSAPDALRAALQRDTKDILAGRWRFFGYLPLQVDRPPKWQFDYLVQRDFQTTASAFDLDHRAQPHGADIKVIWEPSRWQQLVRLAMSAYILRDPIAGMTCMDWLLDWQKNNPPYTGLNWTSALETGLRLIQFTWIDALLTAADLEQTRLAELRKTLLPHHFWYTARHLSFGSSANNHLLGELAGLAVSLARFPALASIGPHMDQLRLEFEREVLLQFAPDGGNREQALSYHLFSWELGFHAELALTSSGHPIAPNVSERLRKAAHFYASVKMPNDPFEYGDSDNAAVTPFEIDSSKHADEFRLWFIEPISSPALKFWLPDFDSGFPKSGWSIFSESGYAAFHHPRWQARLDASELGYLATAAHGHLDALHFSLWQNNSPLIIDPGTGAYYADKKLRDHLSSWSAHNGPHLSGQLNFPQRYGTFLWGKPHPRPILSSTTEATSAEIELHGCMLRRHVRFDGRAWEIRDESKLLTGEANPATLGDMRVNWHFAPETRLEKISEHEFRLTTPTGAVRITLKNWSVVKWANLSAEVDYDTICSTAFRAIAYGPILHLQDTLDSLEACVTRFTAE
jgi:hypothetical protein